jgi:uncharacterized protein (DUF305 family)
MMNKNLFVGLGAGILIGSLGMFGAASINSNRKSAEQAPVQQIAKDHSQMSMAEMTTALENLYRDDFDKAFMEMMIAHHQGAIDMSRLIEERAKHDEIKKFSQDITSAQYKEITVMKQWQKDWGYAPDEVNNNMHGGH